MSNTTDPTQADVSAEPTEAVTTPIDIQAEPASSEDVMQAATARIQELEQALAEANDKWMRSEAEMQNLRTRTKREVEDARQYAVQKFARDVVEAAENLRRGLASIPAQTEAEDSIITRIREGIESTERSFISILERNGVSGNDPSGQPFDANLHQAMAEQPSEEHAHGHVIQAWTPTWTLHGRLLKPAMVVVAKNEGGSQG